MFLSDHFATKGSNYQVIVNVNACHDFQIVVAFNNDVSNKCPGEKERLRELATKSALRTNGRTT